jgi:hypothetical protein
MYNQNRPSEVNTDGCLQKGGDKWDLMKGGEGSKGGKVIGHTKSGKPIYDNHYHSSHKEFTHDDHKDAYHVHDKIVNEAMDRMPSNTKEGEGGEDEKLAKKHIAARDSHLNRFHKKYSEAHGGQKDGLAAYKYLVKKD